MRSLSQPYLLRRMWSAQFVLEPAPAGAGRERFRWISQGISTMFKLSAHDS